MALFQHCSVLFELKGLPFKEKNKIKLGVTENGGTISFVANKECSLVVTSDVSSLSPNRLRNIVKHQIPVVGLNYVHRCLEANLRLPVDDFKLDISSTYSLPVYKDIRSQSTVTSKQSKGQAQPLQSVSVTQRAESPKGRGSVIENYRVYTEKDHDLPRFPENFQVAKYSIFEKPNSSSWWVLELQSARSEGARQYRVVRYWKDNIHAKKPAVRDQMVFLSTSEEAVKVYEASRDSMKADGLKQRSDAPLQVTEMGSAPLQQLLLEEKLHAGELSQEVGVFVELLWQEALGCLEHVLKIPVHKISLNDVTRAEGLLLQIHRKLIENKYEEMASLWSEYGTLLPKQVPTVPGIFTASKELDLCQLIRDILNVTEMTLGSAVPSSVGKYRALRCSIEAVPIRSSEFEAVASLIQHSEIQVQKILRVNRAAELQNFRSEIGNIKSLLHSSGPKNFVGILSRGLLLPRVVVEYHGIARTDAGNLGSGIYFTDDISTSLKYSQCSMTEGSRMLLVCDVALGRCKDLLKKDLTLTQAPKGHDSVHGVRNIPGLQSEFMDDEYVVYSPDQVKLKYVVQFSLKGDPQRNFTPEIISCEEPSLPSPDQGMGTVEDGIDNVKNPLENVTAGLLNSSGQQIPLQAVHVKCKLMDLLSQVIIFQEYTNQSSMSIEAKYVFPLDDSAAVCGFEAFINGKHVVGQVKEKETARREYKQAIEKGHGAYLMDQDAPDVFTISVGNLPPGATVLIKITFVSELIVKDGSIFFSLPSSVAPWQESAALNQTTQVTVEKVCVTDEEAKTREFHLDMSIEMPHEITEVKCITHKVKMKKTDCKAVVSVLPGEVMGPEGFQLSVTLTKVHVPRMWVEKHPDKDSQACMLVFYPNFDITANPTSDEVVLLLDASQSMKGESLNTAQRIALQILKTLDRSLRVNVIFFGTDHTEAFLSARPIVEAHQEAKNFIKHFLSAGGSTELWRPLRALSLLPPSSGTRNLLLLSDGHIQNTELTLQLLRDNVQHSRLFTCGLSPTANRHMLRALAQAGGGAYEFFDPKTLHTWPEKVASQVKRMMAPGARSVSVKWQQFNPTAPPPVQAPKQLHALFNDCHTLVFGFVPHCTQATLLGNLSGQEIKTMVSTSELQKTKGTFLHKLTARALIRDFEDGSLDSNAALHEGKKAELKSFVIELSKEFSILSQFTSFVAIEERDSEEEKGFTNIPKLIAEEGVDFLPYMSWTLTEDSDKDSDKDFDEDSDEDSEDAQGLDFFSDSPKAETWGLNLCDEAMDLAEDLTMHGASNSFYAEIETTGTEDFEASTSASARVRSPCEEEQVKSGVEIPREKAAFAFGTAPTSTMDIGFLQCSESIMPPSVPKQFVRSVPQGFGGVSSGSLIGSVLNAGYFTRSESSDAPAPPPVLHSSRPSALFGSIGMQLSSKASDAPAPPPVLHSSRPSTLFGSIGMHLSSKASDAPTPPPPVFLSPHPSALILGMQLRSKASDAPTPPPVSVPLLKEARTVKKASASVLTQFGTGFASYQQPPPAFYSAIPGSPPAPPSFLVSAQAHASEIPLHTSNILTSDEQPPPPPPPPDMVRPPLPLPAKKRLSAKPMTEELSPYYSIMESSASPVRESISCSLDSVEQPLTPPVNLSPLVMSQSTPLFVREFPSRLGSVCSEGIQKDTSLRRRDTETGAPTEEPAARRTEVFRRSRKYRKLISTEEEPSVYEKAKLKWTKIFDMQHPEGYWELTSELGTLLNCDISRFASDFLKRKGIKSLGVKAYADILKLLATLLVLQLMRLEKLKEGEMLRTLLSLEDSLSRPDHWEAVDRAVKWARWADRQYPCIYSRLEIGLSWDSSTKQLLGFEGIPHLSPLTGLNLNPNPVRVH